MERRSKSVSDPPADATVRASGAAAPGSNRDRLRSWARRIKRDATTLWFACSHADTPWYAKVMGALVVAYALSPIDLIPDVIPVLGYVDDVIVLPVVIWLAVRLLPTHVLGESRARAEAWLATSGTRPRSRLGAVMIAGIWVSVAIALGFWAAGLVAR